jgi:hypothetical protein
VPAGATLEPWTPSRIHCVLLRVVSTRVQAPAAPQSNDLPGQGFAFHYKMMNREEDKLGEGQFATVRKAVQKKTGRIVAVKCITIAKLTKEDEEALKVEIEVMRMVRPCRAPPPPLPLPPGTVVIPRWLL